MRHLREIQSIYEEIDSHLEDLRTQAQLTANAIAVAKIEAKQRINDQAYFILCWGQFEAEVNVRVRSAIERRQQAIGWSERRGWDFYNPRDKRLSGLSFEERLALLVDKRCGKGSPWATATRYYGQRNDIAHGEILAERFDIARISPDLYNISSMLAP